MRLNQHELKVGEVLQRLTGCKHENRITHDPYLILQALDDVEWLGGQPLGRSSFASYEVCQDIARVDPLSQAWSDAFAAFVRRSPTRALVAFKAVTIEKLFFMEKHKTIQDAAESLSRSCQCLVGTPAEGVVMLCTGTTKDEFVTLKNVAIVAAKNG